MAEDQKIDLSQIPEMLPLQHQNFSSQSFQSLIETPIRKKQMSFNLQIGDLTTMRSAPNPINQNDKFEQYLHKHHGKTNLDVFLSRVKSLKEELKLKGDTELLKQLKPLIEQDHQNITDEDQEQFENILNRASIQQMEEEHVDDSPDIRKQKRNNSRIELRENVISVYRQFSHDQVEGEAIYDKIQIQGSIDTSTPLGKSVSIVDEHKNAKDQLLQVLMFRDDFIFQHHSDYEHIQEYITTDIGGERWLDWKRTRAVIPSEAEIIEFQQNIELQEESGVFKVIFKKNKPKFDQPIQTVTSFHLKLNELMAVVNNPQIKSICYLRKKCLEKRFKLHTTLNKFHELQDQKRISNRDFYSVLKVDTHIHHSAAMSAQNLLEFIKQKFEYEKGTVVDIKGGKIERLQDLMADLKKQGFDMENITLDTLNVQADKTMFQRFDIFNNKYNPLGEPILRQIFLKPDNFLGGRYLAEITQNEIQELQNSKYVIAEWRISIGGRKAQEWDQLAQWMMRYKLISQNLRWMIQIPRIYNIYQQTTNLKNFQELISNIFKPLFEVTINPNKNLDLYQMLFHVNGFDTVDDQSITEEPYGPDLEIPPFKYDQDRNPNYSYWLYYLYANIKSLNILRREKGLNTYLFRPHCGEAGNLDHLAAAFLVADGINHGIRMYHSPVLTYLYYIRQIGIAMSPVSNNKLFLKYRENPFHMFFQMGLNVSLSTDDPLILHMTNQPLLEEYAIASQVWDLSTTDLAEIARNSVLQSNIEDTLKQSWLGDNYQESQTSKGNDPTKTNVPPSRYIYRTQALIEELGFLHELSVDDIDNKEIEHYFN